MAEMDKLSWLVLGRSPDGLGRSDGVASARGRRLAGRRRQDADRPGAGRARPDGLLGAADRRRCTRDHRQPGQAAALAPLVRRLRARPERDRGQLATDLPHRAALHAARAIGRGNPARPDLVMARTDAPGRMRKCAHAAAVVQWIERAPPKR